MKKDIDILSEQYQEAKKSLSNYCEDNGYNYTEVYTAIITMLALFYPGQNFKTQTNQIEDFCNLIREITK